MKCILFSGNHPRHFAFHSEILKNIEVVGAVVMQREERMPSVPENTSEHDEKLFVRHFKNRFAKENEYFGGFTEEIFKDIPKHCCTPESLNSERIVEFVKKLNADLVIVFGTMLLTDYLLMNLPKIKINMHLGLSPWYRGSATLFWPFYNMEPNHAGVTIHEIVTDADAGSIYHQVVPVLSFEDTIHDVACKAMVEGARSMGFLLKKLTLGHQLVSASQKSHGRLYLSTSFKPVHLRVNYDLFDDKMVNAFLKKEFSTRSVKILSPNVQ